MDLENDLQAIMDDNECSNVLHAMANEAVKRMKLNMRLGMAHNYWYEASNILRSSAMLLEKVQDKIDSEKSFANHQKKHKEDISR